MYMTSIKEFNEALSEAKKMMFIKKIRLERNKIIEERGDDPNSGWWDKYQEHGEKNSEWKANTSLSPFDEKTMCVGTCRISLLPNNNLNNELNYPHSTKEVIQMLQFMKGEIDIPAPYNTLCFRTAICDNEPVKKDGKYVEMFEKAETFLVEISSRKNYVHNSYYLHHLPFDKNYFIIRGKGENFGLSLYESKCPEVIRNFKIETQTDEEIESDIVTINNILSGKKLVIVSHLNIEIDGEKIAARENLISLLKSLCQKHSIHFLSPSDLMSDYQQEEYLKSDLCHYTEEGHQIVTGKIIKEISKM